MKKGLNINDRDYQILYGAIWGPVTQDDIYEKVFENGNENTRTRKKVMLRRLGKMEREGLIKSTHNPRIQKTIYVLTKKGAEYAADKFGLEVSNIRCFFSKQADIFHDLMVSTVTKIAERDINGHLGVGYAFFLSETYLKKEHAGEKGFYYPDLRILVASQTYKFTYDVEVDCGTVSKAAFIGKIRSFLNNILIVVRTEGRISLLHQYLRELKSNKRVYMTLMDNITRDGFLRCKWITTDYKYVSLIGD